MNTNIITLEQQAAHYRQMIANLQDAIKLLIDCEPSAYAFALTTKSITAMTITLGEGDGPFLTGTLMAWQAHFQRKLHDLLTQILKEQSV